MFVKVLMLLANCCARPLATDFVTDVADGRAIRYIRYPSVADFANRTNGKSFAAGLESIENIYNSISAEQ